MWQILQAHFTKVGCSSNNKIAIYSLDSLKQLALTFLMVYQLFLKKFRHFDFFLIFKKEEYSQFEFQKEFLQPFENIFLSYFKKKKKKKIII